MDTPQNIRILVIDKTKQGLKQKEIANHLSLSQSVVSRLIKRFKATGTIESFKKGKCGRKYKLRTRQVSIIRRESLKNPQATAREIQTSVGGDAHKLSVRSIQRYLRRTNRFPYRLKLTIYKCYVPSNIFYQ